MTFWFPKERLANYCFWILAAFIGNSLEYPESKSRNVMKLEVDTDIRSQAPLKMSHCKKNFLMPQNSRNFVSVIHSNIVSTGMCDGEFFNVRLNNCWWSIKSCLSQYSASLSIWVDDTCFIYQFIMDFLSNAAATPLYDTSFCVDWIHDVMDF